MCRLICEFVLEVKIVTLILRFNKNFISTFFKGNIICGYEMDNEFFKYSNNDLNNLCYICKFCL